MRTIEARVYYRDGGVRCKPARSTAEGRYYCRSKYTEDERVTGWQVIVYENGEPVAHYTQSAYEKRA